MNKLIAEWGKPAGVALLVAAIMAGVTWKTTYEAMGAQVAINTASIVVISGALAAQAKDKIAELEGRLAVLRYKANNGGLTQGEQLEYNNLLKRLRDLK